MTLSLSPWDGTVGYCTTDNQGCSDTSIPINPKTLGDHLMVKRIKARLTQLEVAGLLDVREGKVSAWEHDLEIPTAVELRALSEVIGLDSEFAPPKTNSW